MSVGVAPILTCARCMLISLHVVEPKHVIALTKPLARNAGTAVTLIRDLGYGQYFGQYEYMKRRYLKLLMYQAFSY